MKTHEIQAIKHAIKHVKNRYNICITSPLYDELVSDAYYAIVKYRQRKFDIEAKAKTKHLYIYIVYNLYNRVKLELLINRKKPEKKDIQYGTPFDHASSHEIIRLINALDATLTKKELKIKNQIFECMDYSNVSTKKERDTRENVKRKYRKIFKKIDR